MTNNEYNYNIESILTVYCGGDMGRENKKETVTLLHRKNIMETAEKLFTERGFNSTTIDDISRESDYSRRTIYAYFSNKEDILNHIVLRGLEVLLRNIREAIEGNENFIEQYKGVCSAMKYYYENSSYSFDSVNNMKNTEININEIPKVVSEIFLVGKEINDCLEEYIEGGKKQKIIRKDVKVKQAVYILWSNISALLTLANNKGKYIELDTKETLEEFLDYGFRQILNSILEVRV